MDILKKKSSWFPSMESEGPMCELHCEPQTQGHLSNRLQVIFQFVTFSQGAPGENELRILSVSGRPIGIIPYTLVKGDIKIQKLYQCSLIYKGSLFNKCC